MKKLVDTHLASKGSRFQVKRAASRINTTHNDSQLKDDTQLSSFVRKIKNQAILDKHIAIEVFTDQHDHSVQYTQDGE